MAKVSIYVVRHGNATFVSGQRDAERRLSVRGRRDAETFAPIMMRYLREQGEQIPLEVRASTFARAMQSGKPLVWRMGMMVWVKFHLFRMHMVREFNYVPDHHLFSMQERDAFKDSYWENCDPNGVADGCESFRDFVQRLRDFIGWTSTQKRLVVIFGHKKFMKGLQWISANPELLLRSVNPDDMLSYYAGYYRSSSIKNFAVLPISVEGRLVNVGEVVTLL